MYEIIEVSIIIPTFNDLDKLQRALHSIEELDFPAEKFEVIVVDDGSVDETGEYVKGVASRTKINLRYVYQENRGPAAARNNGIRVARGEYLLIIDADCFVDRNILNRYLTHFPDETVGGVGGNVLPDEKNLITDYLDYIGVWRPENGAGGISYLVTANAFFSKAAVIKAGFFDEAFRHPGGEEPELCYRMLKKGYRFKYDQNAVVIHSHRTTIKSMIRMFYFHGKGNRIFSTKWPELSRWTISFWIVIMGVHPLHRFLFDYLRNTKPAKAVTFLALDYLHNFAFYCGYRSALEKSGV